MPKRVRCVKLKTVDTITVEQLADRLQLGKTQAYRVMRQILSVSDTLRISGMCHVQDYEMWKKSRLGQVKNIYHKEMKYDI